MAEVTQSEVFACSVEHFYQIIKDYEKYPEFLSEISACQIIEQQPGKTLVEYTVNMIKSFTYQLWVTEDDSSYHLSWEFAKGAIFKSNNGYWKLKDQSGKCHATFYLNCQFKMFIPRAITNTLLRVNLPKMVQSYHKRVQQLYGTEA